MIAFEALNKDMIVFSYQTGPIMGMDGDEGGFSVCLYGNGNLKYCTYKFCEQINSMEIFKMTKEETKMIYDTIAEPLEAYGDTQQEKAYFDENGDLYLICLMKGSNYKPGGPIPECVIICMKSGEKETDKSYLFQPVKDLSLIHI